MTNLTALVGELEALKQHHEFTRDRVGQEGCPVRRKAAEFVATIDAALATLKAQQEALEPFVEAMRDFEAECFFGCLGEKEAGVIYPDETRFALVHSVDNAPRFNGGRTMDDAPDEEFGDIGSFTLGDLRRARASIEGNPTA